jgi:hypothetical protein
VSDVSVATVELSLEQQILEATVLDCEGRIAVRDAEVSASLASAVLASKKRPKPPINANCGCNTTPGCGADGENLLCIPTNTVPGCGPKIRSREPGDD